MSNETSRPVVVTHHGGRYLLTRTASRELFLCPNAALAEAATPPEPLVARYSFRQPPVVAGADFSGAVSGVNRELRRQDT